MDINDQIAENTGLIYKQLAAFNLLYDQDAESFAYEALYRAITTYNKSAGTAFSTYAVPMISGEIKRFLRDDGMIKVSRSLKELSYKAYMMREKLQETLQKIINEGTGGLICIIL